MFFFSFRKGWLSFFPFILVHLFSKYVHDIVFYPVLVTYMGSLFYNLHMVDIFSLLICTFCFLSNSAYDHSNHSGHFLILTPIIPIAVSSIISHVRVVGRNFLPQTLSRFNWIQLLWLSSIIASPEPDLAHCSLHFWYHYPCLHFGKLCSFTPTPTRPRLCSGRRARNALPRPGVHPEYIPLFELFLIF